jgi:hypothetical protein
VVTKNAILQPAEEQQCTAHFAKSNSYKNDVADKLAANGKQFLLSVLSSIQFIPKTKAINIINTDIHSDNITSGHIDWFFLPYRWLIFFRLIAALYLYLYYYLILSGL